MSKVIGILLLSLSACAVANAGSWDKDGWGQGWFDKGHRFEAPEIDPASAAGGLTLLLGGLAVLRGRRSKK